MLLESLRVELRAMGLGVTVSTVRPGFVNTPMTDYVKRRHVLMNVEAAARVIMKGIARRRPEIKFPPSAVFFTNLIRILPCSVHDWLICRIVARLTPEGADPVTIVTSPAKPAASETSHER